MLVNIHSGPGSDDLTHAEQYLTPHMTALKQTYLYSLHPHAPLTSPGPYVAARK